MPSNQQVAKAKKLKKERDIQAQIKSIEEARAAAKDLDVTDVRSWKRKAGRAPTKVMLPSGSVCLAMNPGMSVFLERGLIPNSLMPIVTKAIKEGKGVAEQKDALEELMGDNDPAFLKDVLEMANRIVVDVVVEPKVEMPPALHSDRRDDVLYVDEVDLDDKMFLMNWAVGGSKDLDRFREESTSALEDLGDEQAVEHSS